MPWNIAVGWRRAVRGRVAVVRPWTGRLSVDRCARSGRSASSCHGGGVYNGLDHRVRLVSSGRLRRDHRSRPRGWPGSRSPARPATTPRSGTARRLRSRPDRLPAHRLARRSGVPELSRRRRLQRAASTRAPPVIRTTTTAPPTPTTTAGRVPADLRRPVTTRRSGTAPSSITPRPTSRSPAHTSLRSASAATAAASTTGCSTACASCHQDDYDGTTDPDHDAAGFPSPCQTCHNTTQWDGAVFDHAQTDFPLTGAHVVQECLSCHGGGVYNGLPTACASCHQDDYDGTHRPRPRGRRVPRLLPDLPQHHAVGRRRLRSRPDRLPAHRRARRSGVPQLSRRRRLQRASHRLRLLSSGRLRRDHRPRPRGGRVPSPCQTCHNTTQWDGAVFDHAQTDFPLTGSHVVQECLSCHGGGVYNGLRTACASCHQDDYDGTTDPDHDAAGFPISMPDLSQHDAVGRRRLRPQPDRLPAHRSTPGGRSA